jgi:hypothetical protein
MPQREPGFNLYMHSASSAGAYARTRATPILPRHCPFPRVFSWLGHPDGFSSHRNHRSFQVITCRTRGSGALRFRGGLLVNWTVSLLSPLEPFAEPGSAGPASVFPLHGHYIALRYKSYSGCRGPGRACTEGRLNAGKPLLPNRRLSLVAQRLLAVWVLQLLQ